MTSGPEATVQRLLTMHRSPLEQSPFLGIEADSASPETSPNPIPEQRHIDTRRARQVGATLRGFLTFDSEQ